MKGTQVIAVTVGFTNGSVAYWGCTYDGTQRNQSRSQRQEIAHEPEKGSTFLKLFIVETNGSQGSKFIDSERFPRLGFISQTPALTTDKVKKVWLQERSITDPNNQSRLVWDFIISLNQENAVKLKEITATNVLKRMLLMVGDELIDAPTILDPIERGTFSFECDERPLMEISKKQFARIKQME